MPRMMSTASISRILMSLLLYTTGLYLCSNWSTYACLFSVLFSVRDGVLAVEYPLIESKLSEIDQDMEQALTELNWTSAGTSLISARIRLQV